MHIVQHISALAISGCRERCMLLIAKLNEKQKQSYTGAAIIRLETV